MSMPGSADLSHGPGALGVLRFAGPDAARFLQGQLSADIEKLSLGDGTLAGLHNPQGRTIAVLALVRTAADELLAALPQPLIDTVAQRLRKYVLRSKVRIEDQSPAVRVVGVRQAEATGDVPAIPWGDRRLLLMPRSQAAPAHDSSRWLLEDVRQGMPQVHAATSEAFVAQMLNLDLLGAVAFDKGCYTGQEVIARAHYRGRVKRRLQRWLNTSTPLEPGAAARGPDGRALTVLYGAPLEASSPEAGQEVLAVGSFAPPAESGDATENEVPSAAGVVVTGPLPLPYSLPE